MASVPIVMASNLIAMASVLIAMASMLIAMASTFPLFRKSLAPQRMAGVTKLTTETQRAMSSKSRPWVNAALNWSMKSSTPFNRVTFILQLTQCAQKVVALVEGLTYWELS